MVPTRSGFYSQSSNFTLASTHVARFDARPLLALRWRGAARCYRTPGGTCEENRSCHRLFDDPRQRPSVARRLLRRVLPRQPVSWARLPPHRLPLELDHDPVEPGLRRLHLNTCGGNTNNKYGTPGYAARSNTCSYNIITNCNSDCWIRYFSTCMGDQVGIASTCFGYSYP